MPNPPQISHFLAERHESLWLRLSALHKDICAIAAKKPEAPVRKHRAGHGGKGLISDCRPFLKRPADRLPVAAQNFAGLAVQLGQVLAYWRILRIAAFWDGKAGCRCWRVAGASLPVARLRQAVPPFELKTFKGRDMRAALAKLMESKESRVYEAGFAAGRAARLGPPDIDKDPL